MNQQNRVIRIEDFHKQGEISTSENSWAVAIGDFDGLHLGHRALFAELAAKKKELGIETAAITFDPHPLLTIFGKAPLYLNSLEDKIKMLLHYYGADEVIVLPFNKEFAAMEQSEFIDEILIKKLNIKHIVVGFNFTFAKNGAGKAEDLKNICADRQIGVSIMPATESMHGIISSTLIRSYIEEGKLEEANSLLGYWYFISGEVLTGRQVGRGIGYATANIELDKEQCRPPRGVYAVRIDYDGMTYDGIANIGNRPTFAQENLPEILEVHLFAEESLHLYGQNLRVYLGKYLRAEQRFDSIDALKAQIARDKSAAEEFLSSCSTLEHLPRPIK